MVGKASRKFSELNFRKLPFSYESQMGQKLLQILWKISVYLARFFLPFPEIPDNGIPFFTRNAQELKPEFCIEWKTPNILLCVLSYLKRRLELSRDFVFYRQASRFIEKNLTTPKFFLVVHGGYCGDGAELKCLKLGKKFYQILKNK